MWSIVNYIQGTLLMILTFLSGGSVMLLKFITRTPRFGFYVMRYFWSPFSLLILGIRYRLVKSSDLSPYETCIFYVNHSSWIDIALVNRVIPRNLHFIAKEELRKKPFVGGAISGMDMVFVDRSNRAKAVKSLNEAAIKVKEGRNIIAFPEGTRSLDGQLKPFKKGLFHLAIQSGVPLVPVAISGAFDLVPKGFRMRPGVVDISLGEPIITKDLTIEDLNPLITRSWDDLNKLKMEMDLKRKKNKIPST
jgi:1-acyl-sn-glycerol-3-phosphate acyltransferase